MARRRGCGMRSRWRSRSKSASCGPPSREAGRRAVGRHDADPRRRLRAGRRLPARRGCRVRCGGAGPSSPIAGGDEAQEIQYRRGEPRVRPLGRHRQGSEETFTPHRAAVYAARHLSRLSRPMDAPACPTDRSSRASCSPSCRIDSSRLRASSSGRVVSTRGFLQRERRPGRGEGGCRASQRGSTR